jgi:hypothetical protein
MKFYHVCIYLADEEWGNGTMRMVADDYFKENPQIADSLVVEVYEHGGWFLGFLADGTTVATANDMALFQGKAAEFRKAIRAADTVWEGLPYIRRQRLVDEGKLAPQRAAIMLEGVSLASTSLKLAKGQHVRMTRAVNLPDNKGKWFAAPVDNSWGGYGILLDEKDGEFYFM